MEKINSFDDLSKNEKLALRYLIVFPYGGVGVGNGLIALNGVNKNNEPDYRARQRGEEDLASRKLILVQKGGEAKVLPSTFDLLPREEAISLLKKNIEHTSKIVSALRDELSIYTTENADREKKDSREDEILDRLRHIESILEEGPR